MDVMALRRAIIMNNPREFTVTGNPVSFSTNLTKSLKQVSVTWAPTQSGSGDPSPENVRPISGRTGVTAWRTGKNLFDKDSGNILNATAISAISSNASARTVYIPCNPLTKYTVSKTAGERFSVGYTKVLPEIGVTVYDYVRSDNASEITITTGAEAKYLVAYVYYSSDTITAQEMIDSVQIEVGETATAFSPYSGASYPVTFPALGKNLLNPATLEQGGIAGTGAEFSSNTRIRSGYIPVIAGKKYSASCGAGFSGVAMHFYNSEKVSASDNVGFANIVAPEGSAYVRMVFKKSDDGELVPSDLTDGQVEQNSYATAYEPYNSTIYGGTLDLVSGVLTKEWVSRSMKSIRWGNFSGFYIFVAQEQKDKITMPLCDCYPVVTGNPSTDQTVGAYANGASYAGAILFNKSGMSSVQDFTDWLNGLDYDPYIAYSLPEPVTYQLTPQEITALIGTNTLLADADELSVTYEKV